MIEMVQFATFLLTRVVQTGGYVVRRKAALERSARLFDATQVRGSHDKCSAGDMLGALQAATQKIRLSGRACMRGRTAEAFSLVLLRSRGDRHLLGLIRLPQATWSDCGVLQKLRKSGSTRMRHNFGWLLGGSILLRRGPPFSAT